MMGTRVGRLLGRSRIFRHRSGGCRLRRRRRKLMCGFFLAEGLGSIAFGPAFVFVFEFFFFLFFLDLNHNNTRKIVLVCLI